METSLTIGGIFNYSKTYDKECSFQVDTFYKLKDILIEKYGQPTENDRAS